MKGMVALELGVVERLAAEARAAGLDPARDPIPGLRRDVLFTCTADEEAGGHAGAALDRRAPPGLAACRRRAQRVRRRLGDDRRAAPLPDPGRREGLRRLPDPRHAGRGATARCRATDNAAVLAATVIDRLATPGPIRLTPVMARFLEAAAAALPDDAGRSLGGPGRRRPGARRGGPRATCCDPMYARAPAGARPRHVQPGRGPRRDQVQRDPGRRRRSRSTAGCCRA